MTKNTRGKVKAIQSTRAATQTLSNRNLRVTGPVPRVP